MSVPAADMAEPGLPDDGAPQSKRSRFTSFLKKGLDAGIAKSKEEALKGEIMLKKSIGLGPQPNVIPPGEAEIKADLRDVSIGWHPVPGAKWFADSTRLGKYITKEVGKYPDPTQHWAVLVGEYCHQLWMDEHLDIIYINEKIKPEEWHTFKVGHSRFNDEALRQAAEMVIHNMREKRAAYNLISNNCQNFAVNMLEACQIGAHRQFATTFAIYQRATGKGAIKDLFSDPPEEQQIQDQPEATHAATVQHAQQLMDEHTTQLDRHD